MSISYASGLAHASRAAPHLASDAVEQALARLGDTRAAAVLLFLSADFAHDPRPALVAAARAAQTIAVAGCTALGVMNEDDWLLDTPAAAVMLLRELPGSGDQAAQPRLTLAAPNTIDLAWLDDQPIRYGGVAGDPTGVGPYKVWRQSQICPDGRCEMILPTSDIALSRGMAPISPAFVVTEIEGFDLKTLNGRLAAATLRRSLDHLPALHELALATLDENDRPLDCWPLVSLNPDSGVTVAARLLPGQRVAWMRRSATAALAEMRAIADAPAPAAALMFACAARGPSLHDGQDKEWQTLTRAWPGTPLAGFYGNGQISHLGGSNRLLHQSVVLAQLA
ncbi:FIST C-terminal domain-containing protein [Chitinimonas arctica]|nr:FIST C-terminal domain-containing protein [Chitinimonas arctica]